MARLSSRVLGDAYRHSIAWETLESLVDVEHRMAGSDGEREGAEVIAETFDEIGLRNVALDEFEMPGWWRGTSSLELPDRGRRYPHQHQGLALPGTPAGTERAELVDVGHGTPAEFEEVDVEGKLVMASSESPEDSDRWLHRRDKYEAAIEGGAVGFVFRNHVEGCLPPTGGIQNEDGPGPIPGIGISRELGHRLVRHCADGPVEAILDIDCRNGEATSRNVSGELGPGGTERILVTAHHDAHDIAEGAMDNGAGSALVAEVGRLLSQVEDDLDVTVECITFGAEEMGLRGSRHMADQRNLADIKAVVNLDAIGGSRHLGVVTHGFDELTNVFEGVSEEFDTPLTIHESLKPESDHWPFVKQGVPGVVAYSVVDWDGRGWTHTHGDTLDKLDSRDFRDLAIQITAGVFALAQADRTPEPVDPETIREQAEKEGYDLD